jgi:hypothetical protein
MQFLVLLEFLDPCSSASNISKASVHAAQGEEKLRKREAVIISVLADTGLGGGGIVGKT